MKYMREEKEKHAHKHKYIYTYITYTEIILTLLYAPLVSVSTGFYL